MREIGGYIEFEHYHGNILHNEAIALNCGRNCLAFLLRSRKIKRIKIPYFICNSIFDICDREKVEKSFYHIDSAFHPVDIKLEDNEWLYLVNLYGQIGNDEILDYGKRYKRIIVDQANDYFAEPVPHIDTLYTCRKWFGVADGAFLYTDKQMSETFPIDESYGRMEFLLGRFERTASEFYSGYKTNNMFFANQPIKQMSRLTRNLLCGIDYQFVENRRKENYSYLHMQLRSLNLLNPKPATFMYPLMIENGMEIRKKLQQENIYIPVLWPSVFEVTDKDSLEYKMAENILPIPIDQRYEIEDMKYLVRKVMECIS